MAFSPASFTLTQTKDLLQADKNYNLQTVFKIISKITKQRPELDFRHFEVFFRQHNANSYIIAAPTTKHSFNAMINRNNLPYRCLISVRPHPLALIEMFQYASTYELNFQRLEQTGFTVMESTTKYVAKYSDDLLIIDPKRLKEGIDLEKSTESKRKPPDVSTKKVYVNPPPL